MAKKGNEFMYLGPNTDCKNCKLKTVCFNLKKYRIYRIIGIRNKRHSCNQHDGGVRVVEVEELPIVAVVEKRVREGEKLKVPPIECRRLDCENHDLCLNLGVEPQKEYKVSKIIEKLNCKAGRELTKVELEEI